MNFRLTVALSIVLLVAAIAFLLVPRKSANTNTDINAATALLSPKPADITRIDFTHYGEETKFAKENGQWKITAPIQANADNSQLDSIGQSLEDLRYLQKFSPDSGGNHTPEATGTASPHYRIAFADAAGDENTLSFGKRGSDGVYATLNSDKSIYILDSNPVTALDKDVESFRNTEVKTVDTAKINEVTLKSKEQNWSLTKSNDKWLISSPVAGRASSTVVDDLVKEFQTIRAQSFSTLSKKDTGLDPPVTTITVVVGDSAATKPATSAPATGPATRAAGTPVVLQLGYPTDLTLDKKDSPVYASLAGSNEVFVMSNDAVKKLEKDLKDLRDPAVTPAPVAQATEVTVTTDGRTNVAVAKKENAWNITSTTPALVADPFAISDYLNVISGLRAIKYVDNAGDLKSIGLDPPHMRIEMAVPGQSQHEVLLVGKPETADAVTPMMRQGEPTVYLLQTKEADKLATSPLSLRDKDIEELNSDRIRKIDIEGPLATAGIPGPSTMPTTGPASAPATMAATGPAPAPGVTLEREGLHWTMNKSGKSFKPDDSKITSLLADFTPISAVKYVAEKVDVSGPPQVTVTVTLLEPSQPPATAASTHPAAASAPATGPSLADVLPKTGAIGPDLGKLTTHTLKLYKQEGPNNPVMWKAVWDDQKPTWTFEPKASLIDHLTREVYETAATQPATEPATKPAG